MWFFLSEITGRLQRNLFSIWHWNIRLFRIEWSSHCHTIIIIKHMKEFLCWEILNYFIRICYDSVFFSKAVLQYEMALPEFGITHEWAFVFGNITQPITGQSTSSLLFWKSKAEKARRKTTHIWKSAYWILHELDLRIKIKFNLADVHFQLFA